MRRRAWWGTTVLGVGLLVVALAGCSSSAGVPAPTVGSSEVAQDARVGDPLANDAMVRDHVPIGPIAYINDPHADWVVAVWVGNRGDICRASFVPADTPQQLGESCTSLTSDLLTSSTPEFVVPGMLFATPPDKSGYAPLIGLVRGPVAEVRASVFGQSIQAPVHPLSVSTGPELGAYVLWLPVAGHPSYGTHDLSGLVALGASGQVIASA